MGLILALVGSTGLTGIPILDTVLVGLIDALAIGVGLLVKWLKDKANVSKITESLKTEIKPGSTVIERMEDECDNLREKVVKLNNFLNRSDVDTIINANSKKLMIDQLSVMLKYLNILEERIKLYKENN